MTRIIRNLLDVLKLYLKHEILVTLQDILKHILNIISNVLYFKQDNTVFMKIFSLSNFYRCFFIRSHLISY